MIRKICKEEIEVIDVENKLSNNIYERVYKVFGITVYKYSYESNTEINEKSEDKKTIGFSKNESS